MGREKGDMTFLGRQAGRDREKVGVDSRKALISEEVFGASQQWDGNKEVKQMRNESKRRRFGGGSAKGRGGI